MRARVRETGAFKQNQTEMRQVRFGETGQAVFDVCSSRRGSGFRLVRLGGSLSRGGRLTRIGLRFVLPARSLSPGGPAEYSAVIAARYLYTFTSRYWRPHFFARL